MERKSWSSLTSPSSPAAYRLRSIAIVGLFATVCIGAKVSRA
jgi:hypothetical protein